MPRLSIFISHPSDFLTDCQAYGDGLAAYEVIRRLAERGHELHIAVDRSDLRGPLPAGVVLHAVGMRLPFATARPVEYMVRVRRVLNHVRRRHHVDLIHQLNPVNPGLSAALVGTGLPLILGQYVPQWPASASSVRIPTSAAGHVGLAVTGPLVAWAERYQQKNAAALVLSTPSASARLLAASDDVVGRVRVVPYGVDTEFFVPDDAKCGPADGVPVILFLAGLHERKGILTLLESFDQVVQSIPDCRLVVAGDGPLRGEVESRLNGLRASNQVRLLGAVDRTTVRDLMRASSVYCLPSDGEPFGLSALEAMACGKPVVVTDAGGLQHLVRADGGRKVPPGDADALAQALVDLLACPDMMRQMGERNRAVAVERYSWPRVIDQIEQTYRDALSRSHDESAMFRGQRTC
ncbi:glycosyl transferase [Gemmatimonadetes bacterium T265]|nr:glycosyl transferase [Gemmatimonadetes bacterium T265]